MKSFPLPLRVAAGLVASAVQQAKHLPEQVAELPVSVVGGVLRMSMRLQQQVTDLAIKGDEVLSSLRPAEENPSWATFDEDLPEKNASGGNDEIAMPPRQPAKPTVSPNSAEDHITGVTGYDELSLAQLRTRLRRLSLEELEAILVYEREHANRTSFTGMLVRRIGVLQQSTPAGTTADTSTQTQAVTENTDLPLADQ